jgi:hypothetical protein
LLLQRGKLRERRIRIRLLVPAIGAVRLCEVLFPLGPPHPIVSITSRPSARTRFSALATLPLPLHSLQPIVTFLPFLAIRALAVVPTLTTWPSIRFSH